MASFSLVDVTEWDGIILIDYKPGTHVVPGSMLIATPINALESVAMGRLVVCYIDRTWYTPCTRFHMDECSVV
jgi:hypothetical protein